MASEGSTAVTNLLQHLQSDIDNHTFRSCYTISYTELYHLLRILVFLTVEVICPTWDCFPLRGGAGVKSSPGEESKKWDGSRSEVKLVKLTFRLVISYKQFFALSDDLISKTQ